MDRLDELCWRHLDGAESPAERMELERLLLASPAAADRLAAHLLLHHRLHGHHLLRAVRSTTRQRARRLRRHPGSLRVAVAAALVAVAALLLLLLVGRPALSETGWIFATADGERPAAGALVADAAGELRRRGEATRIRVDAGSRLAVDGRGIHLDQGGIECAVEPGRGGLAVTTPHARIRVVGTVFRVDVGTRTRCSVSQGRVAFAAPGQPERLLEAGEAATAPSSAILGFALIDADTGASVPGHDPLRDGAVVELDRLPHRRLNVVARAQGADLVVMTVNGRRLSAERHPPWSLAGNTPEGRYLPWTPEPGPHVIEAVPSAGGSEGVRARIAITVVGRR